MDHPSAAQGGVILGAGAARATEEALGRFGVICGGCSKPTGDYQWEHTDAQVGEAWEYLFLTTEVRDGQPAVVAIRQVACGRDSCEDYRKQLEASAVARRRVFGWDSLLPDVPEAGEMLTEPQ